MFKSKHYTIKPVHIPGCKLPKTRAVRRFNGKRCNLISENKMRGSPMTGSLPVFVCLEPLIGVKRNVFSIYAAQKDPAAKGRDYLDSEGQGADRLIPGCITKEFAWGERVRVGNYNRH